MPVESHLQMIQAVTSRLAAQSMTVKGWCVTVTAALLGFGASGGRAMVAALAVYVVCAFAVLDAYYLCLERGYRRLYADTVQGAVEAWTLNVRRPRAGELINALRSPAIALLYGASLLVAAAVALYLFFE